MAKTRPTIKVEKTEQGSVIIGTIEYPPNGAMIQDNGDGSITLVRGTHEQTLYLSQLVDSDGTAIPSGEARARLREMLYSPGGGGGGENTGVFS